MPDLEPKELQVPEDHPLLDLPAEERLQREVESLKQQLEEERKKSHKNKDEGPKRPRTKTLWLIGLGVLIVLLLAFFIGWLPRHRREKQLDEKAKEERHELPVVSVLQARRSPANSELTLPGSVQAMTEAPILARADGYLRKRYVDIGDRVRKGQLMAEIEAPDLDQQVRQGRAQVQQAQAAQRQSVSSLEQGKANEALAAVTAARWANLLKRGAVSRQENDQYQAQYQAQKANVAALNQAVSAAQENVSAAQANLQRLVDLQSYENVRAPFDGVVTYRNIDVGALIGTGNTLLFRVAQVDRLRTYIYVPQTNAPTIQVGQSADLEALEYSGRKFVGTITRTANSLDPSTRTMLTEVQVPNLDHTLMPGMFVQVMLNNTRGSPPILVSGDALLVRSNGTFIAVAKRSDSGEGQSQQQQQQQRTYTIHLQPVTIGRDYGTQIEILTGVNDGDMVIVNPNDDVREGVKVHVEASKENPDKPPQQKGGTPNVSGDKAAPQPGQPNAGKKTPKPNRQRGPGF